MCIALFSMQSEQTLCHTHVLLREIFKKFANLKCLCTLFFSRVRVYVGIAKQPTCCVRNIPIFQNLFTGNKQISLYLFIVNI